MQNRIHWVDIAKGIGITAVVFGHIYANTVAVNWLYSFHMHLFFFLGGYLYHERSVAEDIRRRLQTLIIPYFSFGFIELLYWILFEKNYRMTSGSVLDSAAGLLLGEYRLLDFNVHLWFLPCFFVTAVVYNFLRRYAGKTWTLAAAAFMALIGAALNIPASAKLDILPWGMDRMLVFMAFFAAGSLGREGIEKIGIKSKTAAINPKQTHEESETAASNFQSLYEKSTLLPSYKTIAALAISGISIMAVNFLTGYFFTTQGPFMWYFLGITGTLGVCLISAAAGYLPALTAQSALSSEDNASPLPPTPSEDNASPLPPSPTEGKTSPLPPKQSKSKTSPTPHPIEYLGRSSLVIMCIHGPVYRVIIKLLSMVSGMATDRVRSSMLLSIAVCLFTLTVCTGINELLSHKIPWMVGKRKTSHRIKQM